MTSDVRIEPAATRIFVFEEVYQARAAQEQAEKSKLDAFGTLARLNPLNRPKHDTVLLSKWELRHEPFWHVVARREVDFNHEANYSLPITNPHAQRIEVAGRSFEVLSAGNKPRVDLPCSEVCHRKVEAIVYQDALKRPVKSAALQNYVEKYKATEQEQLQLSGAIEPTLSSAAALQMALSRLAGEAIDASAIHEDRYEVDKLHLYYRPVYAFEYVWNPAGKVGVIEIDGLTGNVVASGEWFRDKIDRVMTRDMLFEMGAEVASAAIPAGGVAVKVLQRLTQ
ncbi:hypothetical protein [Lysobacter sp. M15]|uniref:hypothetical protein n=1 Tax=Lysobacter sp. M15 TaxID=2916837 RepID=UPI001F576C88|nr:hypothetical protein [Lysobacter sp. M15]